MMMAGRGLPSENTYDAIERQGANLDSGDIYDLGGSGGAVPRRASRTDFNDVYDLATTDGSTPNLAYRLASVPAGEIVERRGTVFDRPHPMATSTSSNMSQALYDMMFEEEDA